MIVLRLYLLAGMIFHKAVWEVLKKRQSNAGSTARVRQSLRLRLIKAAKVIMLLALTAQTLAPEVLPILSEPLFIRIIGAILYTTGLSLAVLGRIQLADNWSDIEAADVLRDQKVVSGGIYRYIRHPIYVGDLLLLIGLELSLNSWLVVVILMIAPAILWQAVIEERMLIRSLPGYVSYCMRTKRFIPFVL